MSLNLVSEHLLAANGLSHQDLFSILGQLTERRLDYGDLYFQSSYHESWVLEDSIIKDGSYNIDQGVGVRAISGEKTGFAYADQISLAALEQSAQAARTIVRDAGDGRVKTLGEVQHAALYTSIDPLQSMSREEKLDILRRVDKVARAADKRVQEVSASLSGVYELILVAATDAVQSTRSTQSSALSDASSGSLSPVSASASSSFIARIETCSFRNACHHSGLSAITNLVPSVNTTGTSYFFAYSIAYMVASGIGSPGLQRTR